MTLITVKDYHHTRLNQYPQAINQSELKDLIRDLNLSKDQSQILASSLKEKNMARAAQRMAGANCPRASSSKGLHTECSKVWGPHKVNLHYFSIVNF